MFCIIYVFILIDFVNVCIILIFLILTNIYWWFHVIIKERDPTIYRLEDVLSEQVLEEHGAMNNGYGANGEQVNVHTDNIV